MHLNVRGSSNPIACHNGTQLELLVYIESSPGPIFRLGFD
jgi:hypothetical protein